jgi:cold shock CspA family protein
MAKSKETFNKKEKEKKRLKQKQEKREKMEERKANSKGKSFDDMLAYVDENGNISATPPDPRMKKVFNVEEIQIGVPKIEDEPEMENEGVVNYFNESKGFGFIIHKTTGERIFFHVNQLVERVAENDKVSFQVENGPRGLSAVNITKTKPAG